MPTLVVMVNLKDGKTIEDYKKFVLEVDMPAVTALKAVSAYNVYHTEAIFGSDAKPPYQFVEVIEINDLEMFKGELGGEAIQHATAVMQTLAENPVFNLSQKIT